MKAAIVGLVPFVGTGQPYKNCRSALSIGLIALGPLACGGSHQSPASEAPQQSTPAASVYTPPASETETAGTTAWGATNSQPADPARSSMPSSDQSTTTASTASPASGNAFGATGENGLATVPSESELSQLDEAQLAAVLQAFDDGEIRVAQLVEDRTTNADVKRLAHDLMVSHQALLSGDKALWSRLHITPSANLISARLNADSQNEVTLLTSIYGDKFDRDYVDLQVQDHNSAIELIGRIIPDLKSAAFRAGLKAALPKLQAHLRMAESAQESLEKGVTDRQPTEEPTDESKP
jgi:predicted outer membrane protein